MSNPRSLVESVTDRVVHVASLVPVAPARAFACFTSPDLLTTWLTAAAEVQAEVGGRYELFWTRAIARSTARSVAASPPRSQTS